jgi:predicted peptidase
MRQMTRIGGFRRAGAILALLSAQLLTACATTPIAALNETAATPPAWQSGAQVSVPAVSAAHYPYLLFTPAGYRSGGGHRWPLLIFLHGSGERGSDIALVRTHGPPRLAEQQRDYPFILISPQLEADGDWNIARLDATLAHVRATMAVDPARIYVTGLSRGGHATWGWAAAHPRLFAAAAPVAGRGDPATACALTSLPIWAFHGAQDSVVPASGSTTMVERITACGGHRARLTLYPDAGHDSWTRTYANPEFNRWLLRQRRR